MVDPVVTDLTGTVTSRQGSTAPVVDIKQSSSIVMLKNNETARISGLQQTKHSQLERKIPLLGDIPYLGALFRWSYETKVRKELVIFLTPEIL
jgi:type II secretory pathway component GspD/PulD (secretin)